MSKQQEAGRAGGLAAAANMSPEERRARAERGGAASRQKWGEIRKRPCGCGCGEPLGPGRLAIVGTTLVRLACSKNGEAA